MERGVDAEDRRRDWHAQVPPEEEVGIVRVEKESGGIEDRGPKRLAVDLREAGEMLSVSAKTVKRLIFRGELKGLKIGAQWRVRVAAIEEYLDRGEQGGRWS